RVKTAPFNRNDTNLQNRCGISLLPRTGFIVDWCPCRFLSFGFAEMGGHFSGGRYCFVFGKPVRFGGHRDKSIGGNHPAGRPQFYCRMGIVTGGGMEKATPLTPSLSSKMCP